MSGSVGRCRDKNANAACTINICVMFKKVVAHSLPCVCGERREDENERDEASGKLQNEL